MLVGGLERSTSPGISSLGFDAEKPGQRENRDPALLRLLLVKCSPCAAALAAASMTPARGELQSP